MYDNGRMTATVYCGTWVSTVPDDRAQLRRATMGHDDGVQRRVSDDGRLMTGARRWGHDKGGVGLRLSITTVVVYDALVLTRLHKYPACGVHIAPQNYAPQENAPAHQFSGSELALRPQ